MRPDLWIARAEGRQHRHDDQLTVASAQTGTGVNVAERKVDDPIAERAHACEELLATGLIRQLRQPRQSAVSAGGVMRPRITLTSCHRTDTVSKIGGRALTMISLRRIHHVCLRVADLDAAGRRWSIQFGLTVRERRDDRVLLACAYEPYSLELVQDPVPGPDHTGYELARGITLDDVVGHLERLGIEHVRDHRAVHLRDPDGHGVELLEFAPEPDPRPPIARSTDTLAAFHPRKLGHVNSLTGDLGQITEFYCDVLGMQVTDRLGDEGVWLHVNADHHTAAFVAKGYAHFHHLAFELTDWGELRVALDHLAQHGRWLAWGPLRHALGQNLAAYVRIPEEECFVELFSDMEQLSADHEPREWPDDAHSSNTWGILPPRSYFRFDEAAVEAERQGLEALGQPLPPLPDPLPSGAGR